MQRSRLLGSAVTVMSLALCGDLLAAAAPDTVPVPAAEIRPKSAAADCATAYIGDVRAFSAKMVKEG